jgi:Galactose oxidase-like, Early set domain
MAPDLEKAKVKGAWEILAFDSQILAVHAALLHTGEVLFFAGSGNNVANAEAHRFRTRVWHYPTSKFSAPRTPIDLFCCGHALLPGGRLLAAGGTRRYRPFRGIRDTLAFDPGRRRWTRLKSMHHPRWYPALITLEDGRVAAVSGRGEGDARVTEAEVFAPDKGWSRLPARGTLPLYPHLTLLADGRVFFSGGYIGGLAGARPGIWDLATGEVTPVPGLPMPKMRNQAATVLLPPAQDQRVMIVGGGGAAMHDHQMRKPLVGTKSVAIADLGAPSPRYKAAKPLRHARMHQNLVLLPDRTVMVTGGAALQEHGVDAALEAELFDPVAGTWSRLAASKVPRLYHSVALLCPDGRVVTAGSNPKPGVEEHRIEVYSPPYLFKGARPAFQLARDHATYGDVLAATTSVALRDVNLVRPSVTTHSSNSEQRLVDVPFTGSGSIKLTLPADPRLAPPGWYMVFAVGKSGVPSVGQWLRLDLPS